MKSRKEPWRRPLRREDACWIVRAYYATDVAPPKTPGALAIEVALGTDWQKDLEVEVAEGREDIGEVVAFPGPRYGR